MLDDLALTLSVGEINQRLTYLARQRERLRTMLRLAVEAREDAERFGTAQPPTPQPEPARSREAAHA
jgi:hypothetical protein